jgi:hypothetical protein
VACGPPRQVARSNTATASVLRDLFAQGQSVCSSALRTAT